MPRFIVFVLLVAVLTLAFSSRFSTTLESITNIVSATENDEWVYYGFSPWVNYTPPLIGGERQRGNNATWLTVVGYNDSTTVTVYDTTGDANNIIESFAVDRMKGHTLQLPMQVFLKVVSDKPMAVLMHGGFNRGQGADVFYPSTDGGFAGREFIFRSVPARDVHARTGFDYVVFAIEDSVIMIRDKDDKIIRTLNVPAESSKRLELFEDRIYRITSTGRVMISSWMLHSFAVCPSATGGHVGQLFFANPDYFRWGTWSSSVLLIVAQNHATQVNVFDMDTASKIGSKDLQLGETWFLSRQEGDRLMVETEGNVIVYTGTTMVPEGVPESPGYIANGISFLIVLANEPTNIFVPSRAHVFSPSSDAEIAVNGLMLTVPRGSHKEIPSGSVRIIANATVVVEVISDVYYHIDQSSLRQRAGIMNFAAHLLPANQLEITYPPPKPTEEGPSSADELNILLVGVAVALIAAAAFVLLVRRRS